MLVDYLINKPTITSDRLIIRPFKNNDVESLKKWTNDLTIYKYWGKNPGKYDLHPELLIDKKEKPSKSFHLYLERKDNKEVIGDIYIYLIEKDIKAKIAIRINPKYHKLGYGSEAINSLCNFCFNNTELETIWTDVDKNNIASIRLLEKCNFKRIKEINNRKMVSVVTDFYIYELIK